MKTIKIKDYYGIYQEIPVSDELYEEWRALQNETQRIHRKEVYHRDWTPMDDLEEMPQHFTLNELEDALIWDEQVVELYAAISQLTPIQQRRIRMLMDDMSIREIARREGCHMNAALKSGQRPHLRLSYFFCLSSIEVGQRSPQEAPGPSARPLNYTQKNILRSCCSKKTLCVNTNRRIKRGFPSRFVSPDKEVNFHDYFCRSRQ